ncbi:MAG: glycerophosphodiester phosphodiesterase [Erythrobacter sp.]|nr:glycerophosphodiester phosphodiesterase [Erythrobacter sp.]
MASDRPAPDWLTRTHFAHRGLHSAGVPENSLAAAEAAIERGFGIECDIQRSRDDWPMVFHDWELDRLTQEQGLFEDRTADELETIALLATNQTPVRLPDFLSAIAGRVPLLIEIKSQPGYDVEWTSLYVSRMLADYSGPVGVMSFDARVPEWFARHCPATIRGLVGTDSFPNGFETVWRDRNSLDKAQPEFLAIDRRDLCRPEATEWRSQGKPLLTWTVRTIEERHAAFPLADALIGEGEALS